MKIFEGKFRGKRITYHERKGRRITSEKVRKSVFDILKGIVNIEGKRVLDLFAGTGMYGLEVVSRGASFCLFVDKNRRSIEEINKNIEILNIGYCTETKVLDWKKFMEHYGSTLQSGGQVQEYGANFDLIFADPPYFDFDLGEFSKIHKILEKGGIFVLEYSSRIEAGDFVGLEKLTEKKYGDTRIAIFKKSKNQSSNVKSNLKPKI